LEPSLTRVGAEARTRYYLEFGRSYASATHKPEQQTAETRQLASTAYKAAIGEAKAARLDGLLVDALHMMEFVESSQEAKLTWIREAIVVASSSTQEDTRRWLAALRNNAGYTLHQMGRYQEALNEFEAALVLREAQGQPESIRIARWMVGWTLRSLGRIDEALAIQLRLERERNEASRPSPFVFAELSELYRERGEADKAEHYKQLKQRLESPK
jgi:tetratricopeptide (TPR) repeat protein